MKCDKCGHENEASSLFCQNCGNPIRSLEKWETRDTDTIVREKTESLVPERRTGHPVKNKGVIITIAVIAGVLLIAGTVFGFVSFQKANAINSGLKNGEDLLSAQNYTEALVAFDGVLKLDWNNAAAIFGKAKAYAGAGNYKMANTFFEEVLLKEKNKEKLRAIFDAYIASEIMAGALETDLFALLDRATEVTGDSKYADQKSSYSVKAPSFNLNPGTYQGEQKLEIVKADANDKVFFTTDGSRPTVSSITQSKTGSPPLNPAIPSNIKTVLKPDIFERYLTGHPDRAFVNKLLDILRNGANIGFCGNIIPDLLRTNSREKIK